MFYDDAKDGNEDDGDDGVDALSAMKLLVLLLYLCTLRRIHTYVCTRYVYIHLQTHNYNVAQGK